MSLEVLSYNDDPNSELCQSCPFRFGFGNSCELVVQDLGADAHNVFIKGRLLRVLDGDDQQPVCVHPYRVSES